MNQLNTKILDLIYLQIKEYSLPTTFLTDPILKWDPELETFASKKVYILSTFDFPGSLTLVTLYNLRKNREFHYHPSARVIQAPPPGRPKCNIVLQPCDVLIPKLDLYLEPRTYSSNWWMFDLSSLDKLSFLTYK